MSAQENKITIILIAVVVLFMVCQLPTAINLLYTSWFEPPEDKESKNLSLGKSTRTEIDCYFYCFGFVLYFFDFVAIQSKRISTSYQPPTTISGRIQKIHQRFWVVRWDFCWRIIRCCQSLSTRLHGKSHQLSVFFLEPYPKALFYIVFSSFFVDVVTVLFLLPRPINAATVYG